MIKEKIHVCPVCNGHFVKSKIKRVYGKESSVYVGGYCSSKCYTDDVITDNPRKSLTQELASTQPKEESIGVHGEQPRLIKWANDGYPHIDLSNEGKAVLELVRGYKDIQADNEKLKKELAAMYSLNKEGWSKVEAYEKLKISLIERNKELKEALKPLANLDLTGVRAEIVYARDKTKITVADVNRAIEALNNK